MTSPTTMAGDHRADIRDGRAVHDAGAKVDPAVLAEAGSRLAGSAVHRDEASVARVVEDTLVLAVSPVGEGAERRAMRHVPPMSAGCGSKVHLVLPVPASGGDAVV